MTVLNLSDKEHTAMWLLHRLTLQCRWWKCSQLFIRAPTNSNDSSFTVTDDKDKQEILTFKIIKITVTSGYFHANHRNCSVWVYKQAFTPYFAFTIPFSTSVSVWKLDWIERAGRGSICMDRYFLLLWGHRIELSARQACCQRQLVPLRKPQWKQNKVCFFQL